MAAPLSNSPGTNLNITKPQQEKLEHLSHLLHLFHHRNRNQHRRAIWYRHFSTFRKELLRLLDDISALNATPETHLERSRKAKNDAVVRARVEERVRVWREVYVGKWYEAFGGLVGDGRFAVLGVVLMAVLGEVCGVVGLTQGLEEAREEEVRGVIERFGREMEMEGEIEGLVGGGEDGGGGEDVGVAVRRDEGRSVNKVENVKPTEEEANDSGRQSGTILDSSTDRPTLPDPKETANQKAEVHSEIRTSARRPSSSTKSKVVKKKRKKGDAIDDLFRGLG